MGRVASAKLVLVNDKSSGRNRVVRNAGGALLWRMPEPEFDRKVSLLPIPRILYCAEFRLALRGTRDKASTKIGSLGSITQKCRGTGRLLKFLSIYAIKFTLAQEHRFCAAHVFFFLELTFAGNIAIWNANCTE